MKNRILYTLLLPLLVLLGLLALHGLPQLSVFGIELKRVNLFSDVGVPSSVLYPVESSEDPVIFDSIPEIKLVFEAEHPAGMTIIEDYSSQKGDSAYAGRGMDHFYEMLCNARQLGRTIKIAYFGDSFIEGDILTDQLRSRLQTTFGGEGVGYVDMASPTAGFRQSVRAKSKGWVQHCITDSVHFDRSRQGLAERFYVPIGEASTTLNGLPKQKSKHQDSCSVSSIYFRSPEGISITARINGEEPQTFEAMGSDEIQTIGVR